ncbi:MAG: riboflavin biosynthesis protein RibF [Verrucomicrobiota bacterium]
MKVLHHFDHSLRQYGIRHLALGFFDGLHRGHHAVIVNEITRDALDQTCVLTFWPHPMEVLSPDDQPVLLTNISDKTEILRSWGIGFICVVPFDTALAHQPYPEFLDSIQQNFPALKSVSVGPNFRFGKQRGGTPLSLAEWCAERDLLFNLADFMLDGSDPISSTRIRALLEQGDLPAANRLLGRSYQISGTVIKGNQLGRKLGFPTANISLDSPIHIPHGVYQVQVELADQQQVCGALNHGLRPSVDGPARETTEVHLIDWAGDLYDQPVRCKLMRHIRPETEFSTLDLLKDQIVRDIDACRACEAGAAGA